MTVTGNRVGITDSELEEFADLVKMVMRDHGPLNLLLGDVDFKPQEYYNAIRLAVSEYNILPPLSSVDFRGIPESVLFHWTAYYLMLSQTFLQLRNQSSVPTDNIGVIGIDDKAGLYQGIAQNMKMQAKSAAKEYKVAQNIQSGYGSLSSGYAHVSRFQQ